MLNKDETAQLLADAHFRLDQGVTRIFRLIEPGESDGNKPVKLLEVNPMTTEVGIAPVGMGADPARNVFYPSVVVEISPAEFDQVAQGRMDLPDGWRLGRELFASNEAVGARA